MNEEKLKYYLYLEIHNSRNYRANSKLNKCLMSKSVGELEVW